MVNVAFRFDVDQQLSLDSSGRLNWIVEYLKQESPCFVLYFHEPHSEEPNPHYHGYAEGYKRTPTTLRNKMKEYMGVSGADYFVKSNYSVDHISYMSKGCLDPVYCQGFTPELIAEQKANGFEKPKKLSKRKTIEDKVKNGEVLTKWEMFQVMRDLREECGCAATDTKCALKHVIEVLRVNKQVIGEYKVKDYYDSMMMYDATSDFISRLDSRINPPVRY